MEYKKIVNENNTIHVVESNRFKEMHIVLYFTKEINNKEIALGNLLCPNLTYSCKKYDSKSKIATRGEELYGAKVSAFFDNNGSAHNFTLGLQILNPKYTEEKYLDESLDFLYQVLLNPNVDGKGFNEEIFNIIKKDYINYVKSIKDNPNDYAGYLYDKIMYKGTVIEKVIPDVKEIEEVTREKLYEYYKSLFNGDYKLDIVIYGEGAMYLVDKVNEKFKSIKSNNKKLDFNIKHKFNDKVTDKTKVTKFKQSKLLIGYRFKDLNDHELKHVIRIYNAILGSMNDSLLFNYVREKYSLCYSINSSYNRYDPVLTISSGINKNNYEEAKKRIFEVMELMKDKNIISKYFNQAKETLNTFINSYYDDIYAQINHYYYAEFDLVDEIEELRNNINNVTLDEVINLNKKLYLSVIFFMKGDE